MKARIPKGPSMNDMLKQAQKMQEDMANLQAELEEREYDISAGGGAVNLKINGKKQITELNIAPEIVDPDDVETLADIIIAAVNEGISKVEKGSETEMGKITGGMGMGMPGMPFKKIRAEVNQWNTIFHCKGLLKNSARSAALAPKLR